MKCPNCASVTHIIYLRRQQTILDSKGLFFMGTYLCRKRTTELECQGDEEGLDKSDISPPYGRESQIQVTTDTPSSLDHKSLIDISNSINKDGLTLKHLSNKPTLVLEPYMDYVAYL
ncbi:hypothetical protein OUZ56_008078 [Daphnia magna]|uniref:Uncharacterized protein n=1 Tax=Daphnia magna TaxID=35525 RepID=A0ABR0ABW3_9CRUS|nr:hypothetical protein OUZ56_008078 [Daphnia magna]